MLAGQGAAHQDPWTDSAMFSQLPLSGVYSGSTAWANSQEDQLHAQVPRQIVQTRIRRSGGSGCGP